MKTTKSVVIRIILWIIMLIGGAIVSIYYDMREFSRLFYSIEFHIVTFILGIVVMRFSFRAASKGGRELAKRGRDGDIPRLETNRLVTSGIYSKMRHPMLFGLALLPLSVALILGSPTFIIFVAPIEMIFIVAMILTFEEAECKAKFGDSYIEYSQSVPAVCFKIECLRELFLS